MLAYVARRLALAVGTVFAAVLITLPAGARHATAAPAPSGSGPAPPRRRSPRRTQALGWDQPADRAVLRLPRSAGAGSTSATSLIDGRDDRRRPGRPAAGHRLHRAASRRCSPASSASSSASPPPSAAAGCRPVHQHRQRHRALPAGVLGRRSCSSTCCPSSSSCSRPPATSTSPTDPAGWFNSLRAPGADADRRRRGDHRPHRLRRDARGAAARSTSARCGRWARRSGGSATCTRCGSPACPVVSVLGIQFIALFGGSVIIENLFALPGLGQASQAAALCHDFPALIGVVVVATSSSSSPTCCSTSWSRRWTRRCVRHERSALSDAADEVATEPVPPATSAAGGCRGFLRRPGGIFGAALADLHGRRLAHRAAVAALRGRRAGHRQPAGAAVGRALAGHRPAGPRPAQPDLHRRRRCRCSASALMLLVAFGIGLPLALIAAERGRRTERVISRLTEVVHGAAAARSCCWP